MVDKYLKTVDSNWYRQRLNSTIYIVLAVFVLLIARLFYLQAIEGPELRRLSENNSIRLQSIEAPRGLIFDREGTLLVDNRPSFELNIVLKDARPLDRTLRKLSYYVDASADELKQKISKSKIKSSFTPILLKSDIGRDVLAVIEAHKFDLPGSLVNIKPRRHYLFNPSGAHLIGYLGEINADELRSGRYATYRQGDYIGRFGIEKAFENYLRGERGGSQVEVNVTGQVVRKLSTVDAQPGHNIYLTIDSELQRKTEELLGDKAGAAVAMDPSSGKILAMASSPAFDQNAFVEGMSRDQWQELVSNPYKPLQNKAIQGEYPPASTYKMITAIAALEEGIVDEKTTFFCPGHYWFGDRLFKCWKKEGHGHVNIRRAISESCDVFFYQAGQQLGVDKLAEYAKAYGLGEPSHVDLDHEAGGLVPTKAWKERRFGIPWLQGETLSVAIGQGYNLVTPLQMSIATSAVANGGTLYSPIILERVETADGRVIKTSAPKVVRQLSISKTTQDLVKRGLWEVVNSSRGTARGIRLKGVDISGKTGTAQIVSRKEDEADKETEDEEDLAEHLRPHAWFIAYAPSENPRIAVSVVVEHGEHGSSMAAPIAKAMIETFLQKVELLPKVVAKK